MARPLLPSDQLKNARRYRKSPTTGSRIEGLPEPTPAEIKRWEALVDACTRLVMTNDRVCNKAKKAKIRIRYTDKGDEPSWFPTGRYVERTAEYVVRSYNAEQILLRLWERKLAKYSPGMLYTARMKYLSNLTSWENELLMGIDVDKVLDTEQILAHNVDYILEET